MGRHAFSLSGERVKANGALSHLGFGLDSLLAFFREMFAEKTDYLTLSIFLYDGKEGICVHIFNFSRSSGS
jgi:hypothetical protein